MVAPRVVRRRPRVVRRRRLNAIRRPGRSLVINKMIGKKIHYFKRTAYFSGFLAGSSTLDVFSSIQFTLGQVPNVSEFTNLFDCYRINGVKVKLMPRANSSEIGTNQGMIKLFSAIDYDDATVPTAITELMQYENLKTTASNRDHSRYFKPKIAKTVFQTALASGYSQGTGWLDCDNTSVPHYGLKLALQQLPAGAQSFDCQITYYLAFKQVR